jgi:hypothetical protein
MVWFDLGNRMSRAIVHVLVLMTIACCVNQQVSAQRPKEAMMNTQHASLQDLIMVVKFKNDGFLYTGAHPEIKRLYYEASVNQLIRRLMDYKPKRLTKQAVMQEFKPTLADFDDADSEDKDAMLSYLEQIMDILSIESSDGMLNKWRYGFDPAK